ncbi:MAG: hypothetical protein DYH03_20370 [Nitrospira sp. NTP1]|nr:hypothetical protein [Nitrospira sp. NTP1]
MICLPVLLPSLAPAQTMPQQLRVIDTPSDGGGSLTVLWASSATDSATAKYQILAHEGGLPQDPTAWKVVAEFPANTRYVREGKSAWWTRSGDPNDHLMFGAIVFYAINLAKRKDIFLRRIPGLDAVDEAIGRATELGKPVLYMTGAHDMNDPSTIAAAVILGRVAKKAASYETELLVPHREPITMAVCQEITKQAYMEAGKPDLFKDDANFFITSDQFSYTAAVDGIMLRRKPAANFFMGSYFAESLLLTETGASTGAIQIAGTDSDHQLPFFVTTCDYTLIGEELYAASAYLSKEPIQIGTLRGQDLGKAFILSVIGIGTLLATVAVITGNGWAQPLLDLFKDLK